MSAHGPSAKPPLLAVMGVSGSGKTTIGEALARRLGVPFADADEFHSAANVAKMSAGTPLGDADRLPWLRDIGAWLSAQGTSGGVATCSALRRKYRDVLRDAAPGVVFVHLAGSPEVIARRITERRGHYMPPSLLGSQFDTLEPLAADERGVTLDVDQSVDGIVEDYLDRCRHPKKRP